MSFQFSHIFGSYVMNIRRHSNKLQIMWGNHKSFGYQWTTKTPNERKELRRTKARFISLPIGWSELQHQLLRSSRIGRGFDFERPGTSSHPFPIACLYKLLDIHYHEGKKRITVMCFQLHEHTTFFFFHAKKKFESPWVSQMKIDHNQMWRKKINGLTSKLFQRRLLPPYLPSGHLQHAQLCQTWLQVDLEQTIQCHFSRK